MVLSLWLHVPPPPVNCPAADRRRRETMCLKGLSSFFTFQFCRPHFGNFFGRENTVAKIPVNRAMISGILNRRGFSGTAGKRRANGFPLLVISTGSPSTSHEATRGKRFRKSLTVAVFIVIQMCITELKGSSLPGWFNQRATLKQFRLISRSRFQPKLFAAQLRRCQTATLISLIQAVCFLNIGS